MKTRKLTVMGVMIALSVVLVAIVHIPMPAPISFLEYDPADIPILISGFAFGPIAGLVVTVIASVIQGLTVSAASSIYGIVMHILATGAYVITASLVYKKNKTKKTAIIGLICGTLSMTVIMIFANIVVTPYFMMGATNKETINAVLPLLPYIGLFNLGKASANGVLTFLLYKRISPIIKKS